MNDLPTIKKLKEYLDDLRTKNKHNGRIPGLENYIEYRILKERELKLKRIIKDE